MLFDPYARIFGETYWLVSVIRALRFVLPPLGRLVDELQTVHCVRHRSIDELLLRALDDGYRQVVLLGAGYETRAMRFAERVQGVRWFEIDHPKTAARKTALLEKSELEDPGVARLPADLDKISLAGILADGGFAFDRDACLVLEGLIHYLEPEALRRLLSDIALGRGRRRVMLTFIRPDMAARATGLFVSLVKLLREVPRQHFSPETLAELGRELGFDAFQSWRYDDQLAAFAPEGRGRRAGVSQDIALLSREKSNGA